MDVIIEHGNLFECQAEAICLPANAALDTGAGIMATAARALGSFDGAAGSLQLGDAHWLEPGDTPYQGAILLVVRERLGEEVFATAVESAVRAALALAQRRRLVSVAFAGVGSGKGGLAPDAVAAAMQQALKGHTGSLPEFAVLVDTNPDMVHAWRRAFGRES